MAIWKNIIRIAFLLGILLMLNACVVARAPGHHHPSPHLHASVHWFYYPDYEIYYHPVDHYYYYYERGAWVRANTLPWRITLHDSRNVRISISGLPYLRHSHHLRRFPPRHANHRDHRDRRDHRHRPDDNDRHDSDNGHRHRPDRDRKEGTNMFLPHTKDKKYRKTNKGDRDKSNGRLKEKGEHKSKKYYDKGKRVNNKGQEKRKVTHGDKRNGKWSKDEDYYESGNGKKSRNEKLNRYFSR